MTLGGKSTEATVNFANESAYTRWFCERVEKMGSKVVAFVGNSYQKSGIPDRYISHPIFRGWIEFKRHNVQCKTNQRIFIKDALRVGDTALVVRLLKDYHTTVEDTHQTVYAYLDLKPVILMSKTEAGRELLGFLANGWRAMQH